MHMKLRSTPRRMVGLLLALSVVLLAPSDCTIDLGNLDEFVVNHEITISNADSTEDVIALVIGKDVRRRTVLKPGGQVTVTSFTNGSVLISVGPARDVVAELNAQRNELTTKLDQKPLDLAKSLEIHQSLSLLMQRIQQYQQTGHGSLCSKELKVDEKGKGNDVALATQFEGDKWVLSC